MRRQLYGLMVLCTLGIPDTAQSQEPTLADIPAVLLKLRGCAETPGGVFSSARIQCRIEKKDLWVSVDSDGGLTLFRSRSYGDTTYARGVSVGSLLRNYASKINIEQDTNKQMLEVLAPYLPTQ